MALMKRPHGASVEEDRCGLSPLQGEIKKLSKMGRWQTRYFKAANGCLYYFKAKSSNKVLAAIDLAHVTKVEFVDTLCGWFYLEFDNSKSYNLKCQCHEEAATWMEQLQERIHWAKKAHDITEKYHNEIEQGIDSTSEKCEDRHSFDTRDSATASDEGSIQTPQTTTYTESSLGGTEPIQSSHAHSQEDIMGDVNLEHGSAEGTRASNDFSNPLRKLSSNEETQSSALVSGWIQRSTGGALKRWEKRFLRVTRQSLLFCRDKMEANSSESISLGNIVKVQRLNAAKDFEIRVTSGMRNNDNFYVVRCRTDSENKRDEWIRAIDKAVTQKHRVDKAIEEHRGSSLADSDDSDGDGAEDWFSRYSQTESPQRISALLEPYLDKVFQEIPTAEQVDEGVVSALYEAIRTTSFRLRARLLFCKQKNEKSIAAEHVHTFDARVLKEVKRHVDDCSLRDYSAKLLLKFIQCIEVYRSRREIIDSFDFSPEVLYPWKELDFLSRQLGDAYMDVIGPTMKTYTLSSVEQFSKRSLHELLWTPYLPSSHLVLTIVPRDFFSALNQHLGAIRQCESLELRGKALCYVVEEVERYAYQSGKQVFSMWRQSNGEDTDLRDLALAVINDMGTLLDHLEQVEYELKDIVSSCGYDIAEQGQMLNQNESDMLETKSRIPQVIEDIKGHGRALIEIPLAAINSDLKAVIDQITEQTLKSEEDRVEKCTKMMGTMRATACDYLDEFRTLMEPYFFEILAGMVVERIQHTFLAFVLGVNLNNHKIRKNSLVLSANGIQEFTHEADAIEDFSHRYLYRGTRHLVLAAVEHVSKGLTSESDELGPLGDIGLTQCQSYPMGYAVLYSMMIALRSDIPEYQKHNLVLDVQKQVLESPDSDEAKRPPEAVNSDPKAWRPDFSFCHTVFKFFPPQSNAIRDLIGRKKSLLKAKYKDAPQDNKEKKSIFSVFSGRNKKGSGAKTNSNKIGHGSNNTGDVQSQSQKTSRRSVEAQSLSAFMQGDESKQPDPDFPVLPDFCGGDDEFPSVPELDDSADRFIFSMSSSSTREATSDSRTRQKPPPLGSSVSDRTLRVSGADDNPFTVNWNETQAFAKSTKGRRKKLVDEEEEDLDATLPPDPDTPARQNQQKTQGGISKSVRNLFR